MACLELKTTIGGKQIYARQWNAIEALSNSSILMNACAQYAIPFIEGTADFDDVLRLMTNVQNDTLLGIFKKFLYTVRTVDGAGNPVELSDVNIDQLYSGKLIDLVLIFKAVCELQYKDFFEQGRALMPTKA
ncbi:MAG: hypothetical protein HRT61_00480 [Ekhidna sp.]|nr:hypothetical protein [Ekhidna sp.]